MKRDALRYVQREHDGMQWQVLEEFLDVFPLPVPKSEQPLPDNGVLIQEKSGRSTHLLKAAHAGADVVVKQYAPRVWVEYVKYLFKRTRASAEWHANLALGRHGIPCPAILAWGEKRRAGIWQGSVLIMAAVPSHVTLYDYLKGPPDANDEAKVVHALARYLGRLHNAGFYYQDLHGENILVSVADQAPPEVCFVDLHEVRHVGSVQRWMSIDDLARLNGYTVTRRRSRWAFLKAYLEERGLADDERKAWSREIDKRTREIWDRFYRKRGRRIDTY